MKNFNKDGYLLVLTVMLLSIILIIVSHLAHRSVIQIYFDNTMIEREKAKVLAQSGIQLALHQLIESGKPEEQKEQKDQKTKENPQQKFLEKIVPSLNRFQEFTLKKSIDGIDGTIKIALCCEDGKININELFDFGQKKFKNEGKNQDGKKIAQDVFASLKKFINNKDLFGPFEQFLKQRLYPLHDVTELLTIPEFQKAFKVTIFYEPPTKEHPTTKSIYLTDIFTVFSNHVTLQPWLLSDCVCALLNLKRAEFNDYEKREKYLQKNIPAEQQGVAQVWDKQLQPLYGKEFKALPKSIQELLQSFEPRVFSVLSYGTVGNMVQKLCAIIEKKSTSVEGQEFIIKKVYWL